MKWRLFFWLGLVGTLLPVQVTAQSTNDLAFLFGYRMKPGMDAAFADGYRRHLDWHARNRDSLTWLGWYVIAGPSEGMFVNGTFGLAPRAFDVRVNVQEDGQDADRNVTAFGTPALREVYRLRRDLGTSAQLEAGKPARIQLVAFVKVRSGGLQGFEKLAREMAKPRPDAPVFAVYERVAGGDSPGFVLVLQLESWGQLGDGARDPVRALLREGEAFVESAVTEVWLFQPDMTYHGVR